MPYGFETIIGFTIDQFKEIEEYFHIEIDTKNNEIHNTLQLNEELSHIHLSMVQEMGFHTISESEDYIKVRTPEGERTLKRFSFEFYFADDEVGDEEEDVIIGVPISNAYFPSLIDWRHNDGGFHMMVLNDEDFNLIKKIQNKLRNTYPIFEKSKVIMKTKFY